MHQAGTEHFTRSKQSGQQQSSYLKVISAKAITAALCLLVLVNFFESSALGTKVLDGILLVTILVYGIVFVTSVMNEARAREEARGLLEKIDLANERLAQLEQQKSEFVSIASHQLRTPLTAIKGYASMAIEGSFGKLEGVVAEHMNTIFTASQKLVALVEDLLTVSRIEQGRIQYHWSKVDVKNVVEEAIKENENDIMVKHIGVSVRFEREGMQYFVWADRDRLKQVFNNIIDNAAKFTPKGFVRVLISKDESRNWVRVAISDTGVGMDKKTLTTLFLDPQKKVQLATASNQLAVVGIGVYIAQQIIKTLKGKIWAASDGPGRGSTFFVELPAYEEGKSEKIT